MSKTRPDSRLYALRQINIEEWGGVAVPHRLHFWRAIRKQIEEHIFVRIEH